MAEEVLNITDPVVVTAHDWQDDGDGQSSSYDTNGTTAVAVSFVDSLSEKKSSYEGRGGAVGLGNLVRDAVDAGIDTVFIGETHLEFSSFLDAYLKAIQMAGPNKISFATLELPVTMNGAIQEVQAGTMNRAEFMAATNMKSTYAAAVYNFAKGAAAMGTTVVAADAGSMEVLDNPSKATTAERLNDQKTYDYLKSVGVFDKTKTSIVHQGINHIVNAAGTGIKGADDLAKAAGVSTLTVGYYPSSNAAKNSANPYATNHNSDPADISIVNSKVSVGATTGSIITSNGGKLNGNLLDAYDDNFNYIEAKTSSVSGTSKNDLIIDKGKAFTANGGSGVDTVSYQLTSAGVTVDMLDVSKNKGAAAGDRYNSIEVIYGSTRADDIRGSNKDDTLNGDNGDDVLYGRNGDDTLYGGAGKDILKGGNGNDELHGGSGRDTLYGENGHDKLYGGSQNDVLYGGGGDDFLYGEDHADFLSGGSGNDTLSGGNGDDRLNGGTGNDVLRGGNGKDWFLFDRNSGIDRIVDFEDGKDRLFLFADGGGVGYSRVQSGDDVKITFGSTQITVEDTKLSELSFRLLAEPGQGNNPHPKFYGIEVM